MAVAFHHLKLVVEPGGAVALAAALDRRLPADAEIVVAVISGGNDADIFERALAARHCYKSRSDQSIKFCFHSHPEQ